MQQSISKTAVTLEQIEAIVRTHFGENAAIYRAEELKEGYFNTAYLLALKDGLRCVLKIAPPETLPTLTYEKHILKTEYEMISLAQARTEMPVPKLYGMDVSHQLLDRDYYLMECLSGTPLHKLRQSLSVEEQEAIDHELGRLTRQLNEITGPYFGYPGQASLQRASWSEAFATMLRTLLNDGIAIGAIVPRPYEELYEHATSHFDVLTEVGVPRLVHWDLWDGNIFIDSGTKRITGIIDFERALWGDPLMEATLGGLKGDTAFIRGYGQPMFDTSAKIKRRQLYNLYLFLIMVIEAYYRDYVEAEITHWGRKRLDETLAALSL